jgi:hypothetical protein
MEQKKALDMPTYASIVDSLYPERRKKTRFTDMTDGEIAEYFEGIGKRSKNESI